MDQAQIQVQHENEMAGRAFDAYSSRIRHNIEKGRESDNPYAITMMHAGLQPFVEEITKFIDRAWRATPGRKARAAIILQKFSDIDVVAYIAFKVILDNVSQNKTSAAAVAVKIGSLLEDEIKFSVFNKDDPRYFEALKTHISDTKHYGYRRAMVLGHMRNKGYQFEAWKKEDKLRVGLTLIDLLMKSVGLVKLVNKGYLFNKTKRTYLEFTEGSLAWIKRQKTNRLAAYPLLMPCLIQPKNWSNFADGGFYTERLSNIKAVKTKGNDYSKEFDDENPEVFYVALNALQGTEYGINEVVLEAANYCWNTNTEVGGLIDAEPLPIPPKPFDINTNDDARNKWKRETSITYDTNAHNRAKRYQCLTIIDTAEYYRSKSFFHVHQADFTGRLYAVSGSFNPQGTDLTRGLHQFKKGAPIRNEQDRNWLCIAGANHWGMTKASYKERIEWANNEGIHMARNIAGNPENYVSLWSKAEEPWQFLSWCLDMNGLDEQGYGFISHHPVMLDGTNNGYQHFAAMVLDKHLASSVNLCKSEEPQDLYENIRTNLIFNLSNDERPYAKDWFDHKEFITRKLIKKPIMMIPYSGTIYGIALCLKEYLVKHSIEVPWGTQTFKHYHYLAEMIKQSVADVCPSSTEVMSYLTKLGRCFTREEKQIEWLTPSNFLVKQSYQKTFSKKIKTQMGHSTIRLTLLEDLDEIDKRRSVQSFPANFVHSMDAANVHLALEKARRRGIDQVCTIHDCYGAVAGQIEDFVACAKESFVEIYQNNVLNDLYDQASTQLDDPSKLPAPLEMGDFDIQEVMSAPYVFS